MKATEDYWVKLIQRVMPKSDHQARGEVVVTRKFFENFIGDNVRFLNQGFQVAGDYYGQMSQGYRWPFGPVAVIAPFNFPLEIPALQTFGSMYVGNKPCLKGDYRVAVVMEQFVRMCLHLGMDKQDMDYVCVNNQQMEHLLANDVFRMTQFTGSSKVANHLCGVTNGKLKMEDAGFDWKVFGPDVVDMEMTAYISDQDAYAATGQKCSAQSIAFVHKNWMEAGLLQKLEQRAQQRNLKDLSVGPILSWNNTQIKNHINNVLKLEGAKVLFGGQELQEPHSIPDCYGSFQPTAIFVPLKTIQNNFNLIQTELFGPFQIITEYSDGQLPEVLACLERMDHHLTCGVVSNDSRFVNEVIAHTVNGTTYVGSRARTTGAPQNHWFGPAGDPRGCGIGSKEAILGCWTTHREIIRDIGPVDVNWKAPKPT